MNIEIIKKLEKSKITGKIPISGAKNSAVAIIPASLLTNEEVIIRNVPDISDVTCLVEIIKEMGHCISFHNNIITIKRNDKANFIFSDEVSKLRGSLYFIGSYLGYNHKLYFKDCGGCNLGKRPINYHLNGFKKLKVKIKETKKGTLYYCKRIIGNQIDLEFPSVGATINLLLAAVLGKGNTIINNAAMEPEVTDVINFLNSMGANITGIDSNRLVITGVKSLHKTDYTIISDRIEAGTYLAFGCLKDESPVTVTNINPNFLTSYLDALKKMGHTISTTPNSITAIKGQSLNPVNLVTGPYPNLPTDLNPIITVLLTQIKGTSTLKETIFENRFSHVDELKKMGANISLYNNTIIIKGVSTLKGATVTSHDLRSSASLILASSLANSNTIINNIEVLYRGYENPIKKLKKIRIHCKQ